MIAASKQRVGSSLGRSPLLALATLLACLLTAGLASSGVRADADTCLAAHEQAQVQRMRGLYLEAHERLITCAQAECPDAVRGDCKSWLLEVTSSLPSLVFAVVDEHGRDLVDARVSSRNALLSERADGRALELNPGAYTLRVQAEGYAPEELRLSVREGEKRRLVRVTLRALPAAAASSNGAQPSPAPPALREQRLLRSAYVLSALALASAGTGIALGTLGKSKLKELQRCKPECDKGEVSAGRRKYVLANIAFGAAGALLGAAVVTFFWGRQTRSKTEAPPALGLAADAHGASLSWDWRF